jgi:hypothetical protein
LRQGPDRKLRCCTPYLDIPGVLKDIPLVFLFFLTQRHRAIREKS